MGLVEILDNYILPVALVGASAAFGYQCNEFVKDAEHFYAGCTAAGGALALGLSVYFYTLNHK